MPNFTKNMKNLNVFYYVWKEKLILWNCNKRCKIKYNFFTLKAINFKYINYYISNFISTPFEIIKNILLYIFKI